MERVVRPPRDGLWRIGRTPDPLRFSPPLDPEDRNQPHAGNRFDSPEGQYGVVYCGTNLEVCFGETLSRLRPDPELLSVIGDEWRRMQFMDLGAVPADWRHRRVAVRVRLLVDLDFLDAEAPETHQVLREDLAPTLALLGHQDLDVALVRGSDRRITRAIGHWAWSQLDDQGSARFAGVRYLSRLNTDWECWAVFHDVPLEEIERSIITPEMPSLGKVAELFHLTVH